MKPFFWYFLFSYLLVLQCLGIVLVIWDKSRAKKGRRRVPERRFFLISWLGGCPSVYLTMRLSRHKTLHKKFMIGLPLIFFTQCSLLAFFLFKFRYQ